MRICSNHISSWIYGTEFQILQNKKEEITGLGLKLMILYPCLSMIIKNRLIFVFLEFLANLLSINLEIQFSRMRRMLRVILKSAIIFNWQKIGLQIILKILSMLINQFGIMIEILEHMLSYSFFSCVDNIKQLLNIAKNLEEMTEMVCMISMNAIINSINAKVFKKVR